MKLVNIFYRILLTVILTPVLALVGSGTYPAVVLNAITSGQFPSAFGTDYSRPIPRHDTTLHP